MDKILMDNMTTARKKGYGKDAELTDEFKLFAAHYALEIEFTNPYQAPEKGGVEVAANTAGDILTPIMDVDNISEINDRLLAECRHYIEHAGRIGTRPGTVKEMILEEMPHLKPLPIKRYEVGVHDNASVSNQQLFKFDGHIYSAPRSYAGKKIGIIAYSYHVELYYKGQLIWQCDRPIFENENRVYAEHYIFDLDIKPRARENAFPLLEGNLPPALHRFRQLCRSKTTKCYQIYMLFKKMDEVGRGKLLKAVDIANESGRPTLKMVEDLLAIRPTSSPDIAVLDQALLKDDWHVEQRAPSDYDSLWDAGQRGGRKV